MTLPSPAALASWLPEQRWFAGKAHRIDEVTIEARVPLGGAFLVLARVRLADGTDDRYALPLLPAATPSDALDEPGFARALLNVMADGRRVAGGRGIVTGHPTSFFPRPLPDDLPHHRMGGEQSNTSIAFGNVLMLKQIRRVLPGTNPEEELTRFLTERTSFAHTPRLLGSLAYEAPSGERATLAVANQLINGCEDGWSWVLAELRALSPRADSPRPSAAPTWRRFVAWESEPVSSTWPWPATRLTRPSRRSPSPKSIFSAGRRTWSIRSPPPVPPSAGRCPSRLPTSGLRWLA